MDVQVADDAAATAFASKARLSKIAAPPHCTTPALLSRVERLNLTADAAPSALISFLDLPRPISPSIGLH